MQLCSCWKDDVLECVLWNDVSGNVVETVLMERFWWNDFIGSLLVKLCRLVVGVGGTFLLMSSVFY